jgi:ABC-type Fe3+ transport system permease subunit
MKIFRSPALVLGLLYLCFFGCLAASSSQLPERVAFHFDGTGRPDSWISRAGYLREAVWFSLIFPLFVPVLVCVLRVLPNQSLNFPNRDYWLAPGRRAVTMSYLLRHSLWFSSMALCFVIGLHFLTIHANRLAPARLSTPLVLALGGCFVAGTAVWVVGMLRYFRRGVPLGEEDTCEG